MGCFFGCFRIKDKQTRNGHLFSRAFTSKNKEHLVSRNRLANLLYDPQDQDSDGSPPVSRGQPSPCANLAYLSPESKAASRSENNDDKDLKEEVKLLKSCGTLLSTPKELQKSSEAGKKPNIKEQDTSCVIHSSIVSGQEVQFGKQDVANLCKESNIPEASCQEVQFGKQDVANLCKEYNIPEATANPSYPLCTSVRLEGEKKCSPVDLTDDDHLQEPKDVFVSSEILITDLGSIEDPSLNKLKPSVDAVKSKKFVHFESIVKDASDLREKEVEASVAIDKENLVGQRSSPYPTPLRLTDEMQTPGTVYTQPENFKNKNGRIKSQFVHPVTRPVENSTQWEAIKQHIGTEHAHDTDEVSATDNTESPRIDPEKFWSPVVLESCGSSDDVNVDKVSEKTLSVDSSLSDWLKPAHAKDVRNRNITSNSNGSKSSDIERPIIGMVAAHWNDNQLIVSPKGWDGKGIPNSTSKYKEDQKVSWHATPFEERLEKALSDETLYPQRVHLFGVDESECDTAASRC